MAKRDCASDPVRHVGRLCCRRRASPRLTSAAVLLRSVPKQAPAAERGACVVAGTESDETRARGESGKGGRDIWPSGAK